MIIAPSDLDARRNEKSLVFKETVTPLQWRSETGKFGINELMRALELLS